jgi:lipoprotein LpqH
MARGTNRILVAGVGLVAAAAVLVGCSDDKGSSPASSTAAASGTGSSTQVSSSGNTEVKVDGQDLAGLDLNSVSCVKAAGKINVASAPIGGGAQGLGLVMTDEATPKVESLGLVVDGSALAVSEMGGMKTGSADVKVDGSSYTITGEAAGADMKNPMAGMITKKFEIKVSCS